MSIYRDKPNPFLEVRVQQLDPFPTITGLSAEYERGSWRTAQFADYIFHYLAEFALTHSELEQLTHNTAHQLLRSAAKIVYDSDKFRARGEFGELLLHAVVRQLFDSEPAISKLYYKDSANNTVKGFDGVHVVVSDQEELELWLGEVKFYKDPKDAIRDVVKELRDHYSDEFLRAEFAVITRMLDPTWEHSEHLLALLDEHTSLDQIIDRIRVPVLLTYDSAIVNAHSDTGDPFPERFQAEIEELHAVFREKDLPASILVHLLLVPLASKQILVEALDAKLKAWQAI